MDTLLIKDRCVRRTFLFAKVIAIFATALILIGSIEFADAQNSAPGTKATLPPPIPPNPFDPVSDPIDAERDWGNTGSDFNTGANWTAGTGSVAPGAGDVAWFKSAASFLSPNLSSSLTISGLYFN